MKAPKSKRQALRDLEQLAHDVGLSEHQHDERRCLAAYADCHDSVTESVADGRNLDFFCPRPFTSEEILDLMPRLIPLGYNGFDSLRSPKTLTEVFGNKAQYFIARESSPCIYVRPGPGHAWIDRNSIGSISDIEADEVSFSGDLQMFRIWWD